MIASSMTFEPVLDKLRELGQGDVLRGMVQAVMQACIDLEATDRIGADRYQRADGVRTTRRNGVRHRDLETRVGKLDLRIPKLRNGSFFPSLLEPRRMAEKALLSVIQEAWVSGVSTRSIDNIVEAMGLDGMDKSKVSRICESLSQAVRKFRERPLDGDYVYVWLDATYIKVREEGRVIGKAFIIAIGLNAAGERQVLGFTTGHAESYETWLDFLRSLVARGLVPPLLAISDAHEGLKKAIQAVFGGSSWQRCRVHFMRNVLSQVSKAQQPMVSAAVRQIYFAPDQAAARSVVREVASKLENGNLVKVAEKLLEETEDTLSYMAFPSEHWRQLHSTNGLERLNREVKRRSDVVGIFPNDDSVLRLLGSVLIEQNDEWSVCRKVYSQESMAKVIKLRHLSQDEPTSLPSNGRTAPAKIGARSST